MNNIKITADQGKDDASTNRTSNVKPSGKPNSDKDFKKIMSKKDNRRDSETNDSEDFKTAMEGPIDYDAIASADENAREQQPSLFDLSKATVKKFPGEVAVKKNPNEETADVINMASADELPMDSPSSVLKNLALKEKGSSKGGEGKLERASKKMDNLETEEDKIPTRFPQESIDLSYVNPLAYQTTSIEAVGDQKIAAPMPTQKLTMQQLVDAVVKAVSTVETQGKTDTVVTLKQPPMFAGSNIVLTSYESAKGQFNISFENLTQQAQTFMNMQQNKDSLLFALQQKGYSVHILAATTQIETPVLAPNPAQPSRDQNPQQQGQQQGRQQQRQKDEEEA
jgi:hypothetical protein